MILYIRPYMQYLAAIFPTELHFLAKILFRQYTLGPFFVFLFLVKKTQRFGKVVHLPSGNNHL
jgi:hypothetical protein